MRRQTEDFCPVCEALRLVSLVEFEVVEFEDHAVRLHHHECLDGCGTRWSDEGGVVRILEKGDPEQFVG